MTYRRQAAIAALVIAIVGILELPAEGMRRYRGGFRSGYARMERSNRSMGRQFASRMRRSRPASRIAFASVPQNYQKVSLRQSANQIDRSGAPAIKRRSIPQGDDRFPIAAEAPRSRVASRSANQIAAPVQQFNGGEYSHTTLSERQVYAFRGEYAEGQSTKAMRSKLGAPTEIYGDREVWRIARNGEDGKPNGKYGKFIATYKNGKAYGFNAEW